MIHMYCIMQWSNSLIPFYCLFIYMFIFIYAFNWTHVNKIEIVIHVVIQAVKFCKNIQRVWSQVLITFDDDPSKLQWSNLYMYKQWRKYYITVSSTCADAENELKLHIQVYIYENIRRDIIYIHVAIYTNRHEYTVLFFCPFCLTYTSIIAMLVQILRL